MTIFASAGNQGSASQLSAPACNSGVIAVGATYKSDQGRQPPSGEANTFRDEFGASFAPCFDGTTAFDEVACFSNSNDCVDLVAPGVVIIADGLGTGTSAYRGTSQASPAAAGVAALMLECNPALTPARIKSILQTTGVPVVDGKMENPSLRSRARRGGGGVRRGEHGGVPPAKDAGARDASGPATGIAGAGERRDRRKRRRERGRGRRRWRRKGDRGSRRDRHDGLWRHGRRHRRRGSERDRQRRRDRCRWCGRRDRRRRCGRCTRRRWCRRCRGCKRRGRREGWRRGRYDRRRRHHRDEPGQLQRLLLQHAGKWFARRRQRRVHDRRADPGRSAASSRCASARARPVTSSAPPGACCARRSRRAVRRLRSRPRRIVGTRRRPGSRRHGVRRQPSVGPERPVDHDPEMCSSWRANLRPSRIPIPRRSPRWSPRRSGRTPLRNR